MEDDETYKILYTSDFEKIIVRLRKRKPDLFVELTSRFGKLTRNPELGKPLQYGLRNLRRIHVAGSFVLVYEIREFEVVLTDFDHHDKIYERYA